MDKRAFLDALRKELRDLPGEDIERSVAFYSEVIDDRMEDGLTEEEAVSSIGTVREIAGQILSELPAPVAKKRSSRRLRVWEIVLLLLGAPLWLPLLAAAACILLAVVVVLWSAVISLYAIDVSLAGSGIAGILNALTYLQNGDPAEAAILICGALVCGGISILLFLCAGQAAKGVVFLTQNLLRGFGRLFSRRGEAK